MIKTTLNKETGIIYITRSGEINKQDLLNLIREININFSDLIGLYIIDDMLNSEINFKTSDFILFQLEINKFLDKYIEVRHAIVTEHPYQTVMCMLFEKKSKYLNGYQLKPFTTTKAAIHWLQLGKYFMYRNRRNENCNITLFK